MLDNLTANEPLESCLNVAGAQALRAQLDSPPDLAMADAIRAAASETGSATAWLPTFWRCTNGPGKLSAGEYFYYKLYAGNVTEESALRFVGKAAQTKMHRACCDPIWFAAALDKLLFLQTMRGAGVPVPETLAVFDPHGHRSHERSIQSPQAMKVFLDNPENYPLFAKPIDGMYSVGAIAMTDVDSGTVHVRGAGNVASRDIVDFMGEMSDAGYLIQRTMRPNPRLVEAFGGTLASVRFLVLLGDEGPRIESAVIKIPCSANIADNFWRTGNMLGAVEIDNGQISRVVTGTGANLARIDVHPETGVDMTGLELPDWSAATSLCLRAAGALPGLTTQSWDIALTAKGPVAMEVNWGGDLNLHQLAHGRGALTPEFAAHLRKRGYKGKLPIDLW